MESYFNVLALLLRSGIAPAQRAQLLGDLIDEVDLLQVIGR